jgi:hypothetical protein
MSLVEMGGFMTTTTTAFPVVQDTYDWNNNFQFVVIVDESFRTG